ncbi:MAG: pentapeptide repeat-containing protein [Prochlorotrichaceae cyanobacterium]
MAAGIWLALHFRSTQRKSERANFSGADLHGANFSP